MIFKTPPADFSPKLDIVGCYVLCGEEYLALQYNERKGGTWGALGGKRDPHETREEAIVREVREESGFVFPQSALQNVITFPVRWPDFDFWYTMYTVRIDNKKDPTIDPNEHQAYRWVTPQEALHLDLMDDEDTCIKYLFYRELPY